MASTVSQSLKSSWDRHARDWALWAREPGHDSYWRFHRDRYFALIPGPGRLTLDLACGEGRVGRDLAERGHRVISLDSSPALCREAATHPEAQPVVTADATQLPLPAATVDLIAAFMALHDIDDLDGTLREARRVIAPAGRLIVAVIHPLYSCGVFAGARDDSGAPFVIGGSYLGARRYVNIQERDGLRMAFHGHHRTLDDYSRSWEGAGWRLARLREIGVPEDDHRWHRIPLFLHLDLRPVEAPAEPSGGA